MNNIFKELEKSIIGHLTEYPSSSDKALLILTLIMFSGCINYLDIRLLSDDVFR